MAGLLFALYYYASPFLTEHGLKAAVHAADADRIAAFVDFPALRQSTKEQITARLARKLGYGNAGAALAFLPASKLADALIDSYVSRDGLTLLLAQVGDRPEASVDELFANATDGFSGLTRFCITLHPEGKVPVKLYLQRGLWSWKLVEIEIPDEAFERLQGMGMQAPGA
jgi:hypothetical protein